jgi:Nucleotidyltransferase domain
LSVDWEQTFRNWSKPSSDHECEKQERAERMIGEAIRAHEKLKTLDLRIISQGSYRNNTNVRQESDVDICVCTNAPFYDDYTHADYNDDLTGNVNHPYTYREFKNDVESALVGKFGRRSVTRGDKAFDVHENTSRVDADVVAAFAYRLYYKKRLSPGQYSYETPYVEPTGTKFYSDSSKLVQNWPEQHYSNGVDKNKRTRYRFKLIVRAVKRLKFHLIEKNIGAANDIASYLIECLIYNVPDEAFKGDSYKDNVQEALAHCYVSTKMDESCKDWREVNELKYLFHSSQPWTREQSNAFVLAAWAYVENS